MNYVGLDMVRGGTDTTIVPSLDIFSSSNDGFIRIGTRNRTSNEINIGAYMGSGTPA